MEVIRGVIFSKKYIPYISVRDLVILFLNQQYVVIFLGLSNRVSLDKLGTMQSLMQRRITNSLSNLPKLTSTVKRRIFVLLE